MKKTKLNTDALHPSSTFRGGEGLSEHYIDCSANPYDLRPAADIIVGAAHKMMADLPDGTPLVILMGEIHDMSAHKELQHMVASRLLEHGDKFTVNFEWEHNYWAVEAQEKMGLDVPEALYYDRSTYDRDGRATLSALLAGVGGCGLAPVAWNNIVAFCYDKKITAVFNDAAKTYAEDGTYLDWKDPFTAAIAKECGIEYRKIDWCEPDGVEIRNLAMAQHGTSYAKESGVNLILQKAGLAHVFGIADGDFFRYEDSLCAAYRAAGAAVLPVFVTARSYNSCGLNIIPESAYAELPGSVVIDGLAEDRFDWYELTMEKAFITEKLYKESGGKLEFYDVAANKEKYREPARTHAEEILSAYNAPSV